jgi:hypothetical protein
MIKETQRIKPGTKTVWQTIETEEKIIKEREHFLLVDACPFFRRLGGSEYTERSYTGYGYNVVKMISTNPDRSERHVRHFSDFERAPNYEG